MKKIHQKLRERHSWYNSWHDQGNHQLVHWAVLVLVAALFLGFMHKISSMNLTGTSATNAQATVTCDYYAGPNAVSSGDGSQTSPWMLATALNKGGGLSGKTLCLLSGTYKGKFVSNLTGATVRSAPGQWAKIDGYLTSTLGSAMSSTNNNPDSGGSGGPQAVTLADATGFEAGTSFTIHDKATEDSEELVYINSRSGNTVNVTRGWNGTPISTHSAGALVVLGGNQLLVQGSDSTYRDFEITNSDPVRKWMGENAQSAPHLRGECVMHQGARTNLINLVLHDCQEGIFGSPSSAGSITYGNVIYNNGYRRNVNDPSLNQFAGHGWYIQNNPSAATKYYKENFTFNNSAMGAQEESVSGNTANITNVGNVVFNNTFLVGADQGTVDNVTTADSFFYNNEAESNLKMGYANDNLNSMAVTNTYFGLRNDVNPNTQPANLDMGAWKTVNVTGNTFVDIAGNTYQVTTKPALSGGTYVLNNNRYYDTSRIDSTCGGGPARHPFSFLGTEGVCGGSLKFGEWKNASHFDSSVSDLGTTAPTDHNGFFYSQTTPPNKVIVRPNEYEQGRANIIVYNWSRASSASVNLASAGLTDGQGFEIRNVQNYLGAPVYSGTYSAGNPTISLPLTSSAALAVAQPYGSDLPARQTTLPEFGAFVVVPVGQTPPPPPPAAPTVTSFNALPSTITTGSSTVLSWAATGATTLSINQGVGTVTGGSVTVSPTSTRTYTLTATNSAGSVTAQTAVTVNAAPTPPAAPAITSFSASPSTIDNGGSSALSWTVNGATTLSINQGVGTVTGNSVSVSPTSTKTYTLTATNGTGSVTSQTTLSVTAPPPPPPSGSAVIALSPTTLSFSAAPNTAPDSQPVTIRNTGSVQLSWQALPDQEWCHASNTSGHIDPGQSVSFNLYVDEIASSGSYSCAMTVTSAQASNSPQTFAVNYTVTGSTVTSPVITARGVSNTTRNTASVYFWTNQQTTALVQYGSNPNALTLSKTDSNFVRNHNVTLTGLQPNRVYYYKVTVSNNNGTTASTISSFRTKR